MITELTEQQKGKMPQYVNQWINVGINTDRLDYNKTIDIVHDVQTHLLEQEKSPVVIFDNLLECWVACNYVKNGVKVNDLKDRVRQFFEKKDSIELEPFVMPYLFGHYDASIFSFFSFIKNELKVEFTKTSDDDGKIQESIEHLYTIWERTSEIGPIFNMKNVAGSVIDVAIVSEKPTEVHLNENNVIHCDGGPAVVYNGFGNQKIFALNGTVVPDWLALTRSVDIDITRIKEISNADVKAEFIRKVGIERLLAYGNKIDSYTNYNEYWWTKSEYELWDMSSLFSNVRYAPHLKMINQTTGVWHVEAVSPECKNIPDALRERFGGMDLDIQEIA